jgi:hypothetical protein
VEVVGIAVMPQVNCDEELKEEKGSHYALAEEVKVDPQSGDIVQDVASRREVSLFFDCNESVHCENADFRDSVVNVYKKLLIDCDEDQLLSVLAPYIKDIRNIARVNSVFLRYFKHIAVMRFRGVKFKYSTIQFNAQGLPYLSCVRMYGEPKSRVYNVRVGIVRLRYGKKWFNFTDTVRRSLYLEGHYYNIIMKDHKVMAVIGITDVPLYTEVKLQGNHVLTLCMGFMILGIDRTNCMNSGVITRGLLGSVISEGRSLSLNYLKYKLDLFAYYLLNVAHMRAD